MKIIGQKNHLFQKETWQDDTQLLRDLVEKKGLRCTTHLQDSLNKRDLPLADVLSIFQNDTVECIQKHDINTFPFAWDRLNNDVLSVFYGVTQQGKVVHLVVALKKRTLVTVYFPSSLFFEKDMKTLKASYAFKPIYDTNN